MINSVINLIGIKNILIYLLIINLIGFFSMGIDKFKAKRNSWRTPETTLMTIASIGGGIGSLIGMYTFRHKTQKPKFYIGIPLILSLEIIALIIIIKDFGI